MPRYSDKELAELFRLNPDLQPDRLSTNRVNEYPNTRVVAEPTPGTRVYVFDGVTTEQVKQSEHALQVAIILECNHRAHEDARWGMIFAIPNGGHRSKAVAGKLKAEGVRAGVPDLLVPVARHGYHGAFIELKVGRNKPTENQNLWAGLLKDQGYKVSVFWNDAKEVIDWIEWYLNG